MLVLSKGKRDFGQFMLGKTEKEQIMFGKIDFGNSCWAKDVLWKIILGKEILGKIMGGGGCCYLQRVD